MPRQSTEIMTFKVELDPSGIVFDARPTETLLDAGLRDQVLLPYGCRNGACGSCRGRVISGTTGYHGETPQGLSEREIAAGWVLLCQAHAQSDLRIRAQTLDDSHVLNVRTLPVRVLGKRQLSHDVMEVTLRLPPTERLQYLAGQYIDIVLRDGGRRAFSLANAPHDDAHLSLHIRHVPGGAFSGHVFDGLKTRDLLRINGPLGSFFLRNEEPRTRILIAGGTGFAPIKSIVENAIHEGLTDALHVYWGVRAGRDLYMGELAHSWAQTHENITFTPVLSDPAQDDTWSGQTGFVHDAVLAHFDDLSAVEVYASGPPVMIRAVRETFTERGLSLDNLFSDTFDYAHETGHDN
jgi:CDP-4-dehydro-6-deoxyglucose reductase